MTAPSNILQGLLDESSTVRGEWIAQSPGHLPAAAQEPYRVVDGAIQEAKNTITSARATVEKLHGDDLMPAAGRARLIREQLDTARTTLAEQITRADNALMIMRATLINEALPQVGSGRELLARHDAQMLLDRATDPHVAMVRLAQRGDDVGALVASGWGRDYLTARGIDDSVLPVMHGAVIDSAVQAAAEQTLDPGRQVAARHVAHMSHLAAARDMVANGGTAALNKLGA